jgi:hypothetical protein
VYRGDMRVQDVATVLQDLLAKGPSEIDAAATADQMEQCLAVLRRETRFKPVLPGEPVPFLSYDLVQAKDAIESVVGLFSDGEVKTALERSRSALSDIQRATRYP